MPKSYQMNLRNRGAIWVLDQTDLAVITHGPLSPAFADLRPSLLELSSYPDGEPRLLQPKRLLPDGPQWLFASSWETENRQWDFNRWLQLILCARALRDISGNPVRLVIPEIPCLRQDSRSARGREVAMRGYFLAMLADAGIATVVTLLGKTDVKDERVEIIAPTVHDIASGLACELQAHKVVTHMIVGPDAGSEQLIKAAASTLNVPGITCQKTRGNLGALGVSLTEDGTRLLRELSNDREDRVVLLDDMTISGESLCLVQRAVRSATAKAMLAYVGNVRPTTRGIKKLRDLATHTPVLAWGMSTHPEIPSGLPGCAWLLRTIRGLTSRTG